MSGIVGSPPSIDSGNSDIDKQLEAMKAAFELATKTNTAITILKTIEGAKETAAQQRPNIG